MYKYKYQVQLYIIIHVLCIKLGHNQNAKYKQSVWKKVKRVETRAFYMFSDTNKNPIDNKYLVTSTNTRTRGASTSTLSRNTNAWNRYLSRPSTTSTKYIKSSFFQAKYSHIPYIIEYVVLSLKLKCKITANFLILHSPISSSS